MLSLKSAFSLLSFTFIKRLFSYSLLSAIRVLSSTYLRLLTVLLAILIPACASSGPAFRMMYSAYILYKQGDNIQPDKTWSTGEGHGKPLQNSCLENPVNSMISCADMKNKWMSLSLNYNSLNLTVVSELMLCSPHRHSSHGIQRNLYLKI